MTAAFDPALPAALLAWYDEHARDLPWRKTGDPYKILVSEIMLQQTQVNTVIPYYHAFLDRFPDVAALARAPSEAVLEAWKGLGYYRRARNLQAAAKAVVDRHGGSVPDSWDAMISLPGVGEYTAAAVLSIAFGKPYPVVDGNVVRVAARLLESDEPADSGRFKREIAKRLRAVIPADRAGDFNQALMELGATVCTVQSPSCGRCPLEGVCRARHSGRAAELPVPGKRVKVREERFAVFVLRLGGAALLVRRPDDGLLGGMWEFPRLDADPEYRERPEQALEAARRLVALDDTKAATGGLVAREARWVGSLDHRFSHLVWRLDIFRVELASAGAPVAAESDVSGSTAAWVPDDRVGDRALPTVMQKVWALVEEAETGEAS